MLRDYCHLTDREPGYRVGDEGELDRLMEDVMKSMFMELHEQEEGGKKQAFYDLVETFAPDKNEDKLEAIVEKVFLAAQSQPDPYAWLSACRESNRALSFEDLSRTVWMREYMRDADLLIEEMRKKAASNLALAREPDGPSSFVGEAENNFNMCNELLAHRTYEERYRICGEASFARLAGKAKKGEDPDKREKFKEARAAMKSCR